MIGCAVRLWTERRSVAAVEFALIAPVMLTLLFGTVEVTQLLRVYNKLGLAVQAIDDMVAGQNSSTVASVGNIVQGGQLVMAPFSTPVLSTQVLSVTYNSSAAASTVAWQVLVNTTTSMTTTVACGLASGLSLGSDSVIIVKSTYQYKPILSHILASSYTLSQTAYGRPRNAATVSGVSSSGATTGSC